MIDMISSRDLLLENSGDFHGFFHGELSIGLDELKISTR